MAPTTLLKIATDLRIGKIGDSKPLSPYSVKPAETLLFSAHEYRVLGDRVGIEVDLAGGAGSAR